MVHGGGDYTGFNTDAKIRIDMQRNMGLHPEKVVEDDKELFITSKIEDEANLVELNEVEY